MGDTLQTLKDIRFYLTGELDEIYHEPELTALINIIIKTLFGITKLHHIYISDHKVNNSEAKKVKKICRELKNGKPLQYILGETIFYDCTISVSPATLIPRPETEELVHLILKENDGFAGNIIDFGTGSGCIAIAIAKNLSESKITGIDISEAALTIARKNALLNNTDVSFLKGDILNFDNNSVPKAGIIISNPPYVRESEKKKMNNNVLGFEPHQALFVTDTDPLMFYRAILNIAEKVLLPQGNVYFEINEAFGISMDNLMSSYGYSDVTVIKDINGRDRIIKGSKNG